MTTYILCYVFSISIGIFQSLCLVFYLKTKYKRILLNFGGHSFYEGKTGSISVQFGWQSLSYFFIGIGKSPVPEIGKEYLMQKEGTLSFNEHLVSIMTLLTFLIISITSAFSFGTFIGYFPPLFQYMFFIDDASVLPQLNLAQTICFYVSCMCLYGIITAIVQYLGSKTTSGLFTLFILFPMLFLWLYAVVRLFLLNHSFAELILFTLIYIFINSVIEGFLFLIFKIFGMKKENTEEIRKDKALLIVKNYLLLTSDHTDKVLDKKTETRLLFSESNLQELMKKQTDYKAENISKEFIIESMSIGKYCFESFANFSITVLIKQDLNAQQWDKKLTFLVEFGANNSATIVPGDFKDGFIVPWIKPL